MDALSNEKFIFSGGSKLCATIFMVAQPGGDGRGAKDVTPVDAIYCVSPRCRRQKLPNCNFGRKESSLPLFFLQRVWTLGSLLRTFF